MPEVSFLWAYLNASKVAKMTPVLWVQEETLIVLYTSFCMGKPLFCDILGAVYNSANRPRSSSRQFVGTLLHESDLP